MLTRNAMLVIQTVSSVPAMEHPNVTRGVVIRVIHLILKTTLAKHVIPTAKSAMRKTSATPTSVMSGGLTMLIHLNVKPAQTFVPRVHGMLTWADQSVPPLAALVFMDSSQLISHAKHVEGNALSVLGTRNFWPCLVHHAMHSTPSMRKTVEGVLRTVPNATVWELRCSVLNATLDMF